MSCRVDDLGMSSTCRCSACSRAKSNFSQLKGEIRLQVLYRTGCLAEKSLLESPSVSDLSVIL